MSSEISLILSIKILKIIAIGINLSIITIAVIRGYRGIIELRKLWLLQLNIGRTQIIRKNIHCWIGNRVRIILLNLLWLGKYRSILEIGRAKIYFVFVRILTSLKTSCNRTWIRGKQTSVVICLVSVNMIVVIVVVVAVGVKNRIICGITERAIIEVVRDVTIRWHRWIIRWFVISVLRATELTLLIIGCISLFSKVK